MRRVILAVFFCLAACGGTDMVKQSPRVDARADRQSFLLTRAAHDVIASFAGNASNEAIDTCLNAWVEEVGANSPQMGPRSKPDADGLRAFLSECLADTVPGDLRAVDARAANTRDLRISRTGDARNSYVR